MPNLTTAQVAEINHRLSNQLDLTFVVMTDTERVGTVITFDAVKPDDELACDMDMCAGPTGMPINFARWIMLVDGVLPNDQTVKEFLCLAHALEAIGEFKHLAGTVRWIDGDVH